MPQYLTPGVYVEEVASAIQPIAGVGTSTAGFLGVVGDVTMPLKPGLPGKNQDGTTKAPTADDYYAKAAADTPVLVTSWDAFQRNFGELGEHNSVLGNAVYGFFNNGGSRAWVASVSGIDVGAGGEGAPTPVGAIDQIPPGGV